MGDIYREKCYIVLLVLNLVSGNKNIL